jgi:hypothetical protein
VFFDALGVPVCDNVIGPYLLISNCSGPPLGGDAVPRRDQFAATDEHTPYEGLGINLQTGRTHFIHSATSGRQKGRRPKIVE